MAKKSQKKIEEPDVNFAPPDGGFGWVVVASSFMISVLVDGLCFSQGIFFNEFMSYFGTNKATTSWIGSVLNGSYLTIGPIVSILVNKYGCRRVAFTGSLIAGSSIFLSTFSTSALQLTLIYGFLGGIGFGFMYLPAIVMVGYYFDKKRALATGIACCGSGIGAFVFAPLSQFLLDEYNWQGATWILSALILHGTIFSMFYRPIPMSPGSGFADHIINDEHLSSTCGPRVSNNVTSSDVHNYKDGENNLSRSIDMNLHVPLNKQVEAMKHDESSTRLSVSNGSLNQVTPHGMPSMTLYINPLEKKDIFYSGSIENLQEYTKAPELYAKSVMRSSTRSVDKSPEQRSFCGRIGHVLASMFDISLLMSPTFLLYGTACFLCMLGFFVPFTYLPPLAIEMGISSKDAAFLICIIGITNTVGRVLVGFVSDQSWADCLLINNVALIIAGTATMGVPFYDSFGLLSAYVAVFGVGIAVFVSLRSIITVELMGLERLTSAFGLVIMFQGLSSYIGPPIAGALADAFGNYNAAFYMSGASLTLSGLICIPLRKLASWENSRAENTRKVQEEVPMIS